VNSKYAFFYGEVAPPKHWHISEHMLALTPAPNASSIAPIYVKILWACEGLMDWMFLFLTAVQPSVISFSPYIPGTNKTVAIITSTMINENRRSTDRQAQILCIVKAVQHA